MDRAGALLAGSIAAWLVLTFARGAGAAGIVQAAMLPFIVGAGITAAVPMLPELVRTALQRLGDVAFLVLIAVAASGAGGFDPSTGIAGLVLFGAIAGTAAIVARIGGVDLASAFAGAGSRDPAVATALAVALGGTTAVPLYSGILLLAASAILALRNRRKAR
jgi:predicted Na+-dependent transporter